MEKMSVTALFQKRFFLLLALLTLVYGVSAQTNEPDENLVQQPANNHLRRINPDWDVSFFSLDAGIGTSSVLVEGLAFGLIFDPKLNLTGKTMLGSKNILSFAYDGIITLETQLYLRWNFLRFPVSYISPSTQTALPNTLNFFVQGGVGLLGVLMGPRSIDLPNRQKTRASLLFDVSAGVTIPVSSKWHIEPSVRAGYPFIAGFALTAGYKFPLPQRTVYMDLPARIEYLESQPTVEYVEVIRMLPPNEIIRRIMISAVEYVLFGPDIGRYNIGIDNDAQSLNELVLNQIAQKLINDPAIRVRIEGHANPVTTDPGEADELMALSSMRAGQVADQLRIRGVAEEQMIVIAFGGTRTITSHHDIWNRNRRVELTLIQIDMN